MDYSATQCYTDRFKMMNIGEEPKWLVLAFPLETCMFDPFPAFLLHKYIDELLPFRVRLCHSSVAYLPVHQSMQLFYHLWRSDVCIEKLLTTSRESCVPFKTHQENSCTPDRVVFRSKSLHAEVPVRLQQRTFDWDGPAETYVRHMWCHWFRSFQMLFVAFEMVDNEILMKHLVASFGISGQSLEWMCSFLDT